MRRQAGAGAVDQPGRTKLGWCWYGNPHTWLGSASARTERVGLE
ncbi:DUF5701 family protein [Micromonospora sp. M12]